MDKFLQIARQIYHLIENSSTIIIHRHINPDGDALGSQFGLKCIIEDNFKNKKVLVPGEISDHMRPFFPQPTFVKKEDYENALVIICDTANRERISGEFWSIAKTIIKIDHHPIIDNYAEISLVEKTASAACQVIAKWAQVMKLRLSPHAAKNLFLGLVTDSGRFLYRSVNVETFQIASFLVQQKFNLLDLYQEIYVQSLKAARIKGYILSNFKISKNGVAYIIFNDKIISKLKTMINNENKNLTTDNEITISNEDLTSQVNVMANIEGIKIWLVIAQEQVSGMIKVSVRSSRWIINDVVAAFGGGGHQTAAGVRLKNQKEVQQLIVSLDKIASETSHLDSN